MNPIENCKLNPEDDEIIKEIPIYHSTRLQDRLYIFRYPLFPKNYSNKVNFKQGFFKPNNQQVQLDMELDVESGNFDVDRAELLAQDVDGTVENRKKDDNKYFKNDLIDKVCLKSSTITKEPYKYAALIYNGREIHLTTLKNIFLFHPHLPYLDKQVKKKKDNDNNDLSDDENQTDDTFTDIESSQQITVKFKSNDDRWKKKNTTFKSLEAKSNDETWLDCDCLCDNSSLSRIEKIKLYTDNFQVTGQAMNLTNSEYLRVLIPEDQELATNEPSLPSHIMSLHALRALPFLEQCRLLLKDAQIIQFQQLLMILAGNEGLSADVLLKTLPKVALLVRGNWVVKSDVLYPNNSFSATSGVPAELMCRARDYVLYLFTRNQYVERKKISSVMKIPSEEVKEIFTGFSKLRHNKGWELILDPDLDFIMKHNDLVQKQNEFWDYRFKQLSEYLKDNQRQRRKSKSISDEQKIIKNTHNSDNESGNEKKSPILNRKRKLLKTKDDL